MSYLGRAVHYVSILNHHHASNKVAALTKHTEFETYIDKHRKEYTISRNTIDDLIFILESNTSEENLMYTVTKADKSMINHAENEETFDQVAEESVKNVVITTTQYIYKFGFEVGIYLKV